MPTKTYTHFWRRVRNEDSGTETIEQVAFKLPFGDPISELEALRQVNQWNQLASLTRGGFGYLYWV